VGPWEDFVPDPGWTDSSLRARLIYSGGSVQFKGMISGELPASSQARIGILEPDFRPAQPKGFVVAGLTSGLPNLEIQSDGWVLLRSLVAMDFVSIHVVYPLD
jgi:hypothetical protein